MSVTLRIVLIVMSILTSIYVLVQIRKSQLKIEEASFWFFFSAILILMGLFPQIVNFGAKIFGVQAPVNFVFLGIIFILIIRLFHLNVKLSQLENKVENLTQRYSIDENNRRKESKKVQ